MTTVGSISVGCFDQNLAVKRIFSPPQPNSQLLQAPGAAGGHVCALFVPYLVPGSQWLRVYDFLLYSMTHAVRKNTENRPENPKLWPLECLNKGSGYAHVRARSHYFGPPAHTICLRGVLKGCLGLSDYRGFHFCWLLRSKPIR